MSRSIEDHFERSFRRAMDGLFGPFGFFGPDFDHMETTINRILDRHLISIDTVEEPTSFTVIADVPGVPKDMISVTQKDRFLTIQAERPCLEVEKPLKQSVWSERPCGVFKRTVSLPRNVKENSAHATLADGVLTVTVEKEKDKRSDGVQIPIN